MYKELYDKFGWKPKAGIWLNIEEGTCCPLVMRLIAQGKIDLSFKDSLSGAYLAAKVREEFGEYGWGFIDGFDDTSRVAVPKGEYLEGYVQGKMAAKDLL